MNSPIEEYKYTDNYAYGFEEGKVDGYKRGRADTIEEFKHNTELFREIFLEELERQAVDREEIFMYRNICSMAWNKYLEQLKEQN